MGVQHVCATGVAVAAAFVALTGCSAGGSDSPPLLDSTPPSSTASAGTEPTTEGSPGQSGNAGDVPKQVRFIALARTSRVVARLPCGPKKRVHIGLDMDSGWPTLRELALALTQTRGITAVVVWHSSDHAVIVRVDDADNPIGRMSVNRVDSRWFAGGLTQCAAQTANPGDPSKRFQRIEWPSRARVITRLSCERKERFQWAVIETSPTYGSLRGVALALTRKPRGSAAVAVSQSTDKAVIVHLDDDGHPVARTTVKRFDSTWFPLKTTRCVGH